IEQHRRLQVEWFQQTSVWLQTWSLSTPMESSSLSLLAMTAEGIRWRRFVTGAREASARNDSVACFVA
ncbi:MAG: hypothetical protein ACRD9L_19520, partial [Bryobacteraceae bacterium]